MQMLYVPANREGKKKKRENLLRNAEGRAELLFLISAQ